MRELSERGFTLSLVYLEITYPARHLNISEKLQVAKSYLRSSTLLRESAVFFVWFGLIFQLACIFGELPA